MRHQLYIGLEEEEEFSSLRKVKTLGGSGGAIGDLPPTPSSINVSCVVSVYREDGGGGKM